MLYEATATVVLRAFPRVTANGEQVTELKCPQTPFTIEGISVNRCEEIDGGKGYSDKGEEADVEKRAGVRRYSMTFSFNVEAESDDKLLELALREAKEKAELMAYSLSLGLGHAFEVEDVRLDSLQSKDDKGLRVNTFLQPNVSFFYTILIPEDKVKSAIESALKLEKVISEAKKKVKTLDELMEVVSLWASGLKDEDPVGRFVKFHSACEKLAAIKGYNKGSYGDRWCEEFSNKYLDGYYKLDDMNVNQVRNKLIHAVGEDVKKAKELAVSHADEFGFKVLSAIKRVISEETGVSLE